MDIKKIITVTVVIMMLTVLQACGIDFNKEYISKESTTETISTEKDKTESEGYVEEPDDVFVINNSPEEIISRLENANNGDKLGRVSNYEIFAFKYPELTTRSLLYSESGVLVRYDDYLAVKYEPEKNNEDYILLVYYFNSDNMWESWYKYIFAINAKEAGILAEDERKNGYSVVTADNIVMVGEQFIATDIEEDEFLSSFANEIVNLKNN